MIDRIPIGSELRKLTLLFPKQGERTIEAQFSKDSFSYVIQIKSPNSLKDVLELTELIISDIQIVDARIDQLEGYPCKIQFETDRGVIEIWAREIEERQG